MLYQFLVCGIEKVLNDTKLLLNGHGGLHTHFQILQRFPIQQIRNWSSTFFGSTVFWLSSSLYFHQVTHIYMYLGFVLLWVECKSFGKCRPRWRPPEAADAHTGDLTHSSSISNTKINVLENKPTLTTRGTGIKKWGKSPRAYQFDKPENLFI